MMNSRLLAIMAIGVILLVSLPVGEIDADDSFQVTDGTGRTFSFDRPTEHVVICGLGATLTVADAGQISKIVAVDSYSTYSYTKNETIKDLDAMDLKSFYGTTNHDSIVTELINLVDSGRLSTDDAVILTTYSANSALREKLEERGFTKVLIWNTSDITDYGNIISFVEDVTRIVAGEEGVKTLAMRETVAEVKSIVSKATTKAKAISLWYSSSAGIQVNNIGIAASMLDICNAENIGYIDDGTTRYGDVNTVISLLGENPGTVIFLPSSWASAGKTVEDFKKEVLNGSNDFTIVQMGALWNNFCPESADGLKEMAEALYPELFADAPVSPEEPESSQENDENTLMWIVAIVIVVIIAATAYMAFKRTH